MNRKMKSIFLLGMLMGIVSWARAGVQVSSPTAHSQPLPAADPWTQRLGLTESQSAKFHAAMDAHQAATRTLQQQMREQMQKMQVQTQNKASDKDLLASLSAMKSVRKALQDENDKFDDRLAGFLTPTQRVTWGSMSGYGMMGSGMMGPGMMGPGMMRPWMDRPQPPQQPPQPPQAPAAGANAGAAGPGHK